MTKLTRQLKPSDIVLFAKNGNWVIMRTEAHGKLYRIFLCKTGNPHKTTQTIVKYDQEWEVVYVDENPF